ncbi:MAG: OmpH family outer membrane protein [Pseudomonadota bacterium]
MTKPATILIAALLFGACSDGGPVGYFDPNRVFAESREARDTMQEAGRPGELDQARATSARLAEEAAHADETTAAAKREKADAAANSVKQMEKAQVSAAQKVNDRISVALAKIAGARRMTLVLPIGGQLPYASPKADLTGDVIAALDGTSADLAEARRAELEAAARVRQLEAARPPPAPPASGKVAKR